MEIATIGFTRSSAEHFFGRIAAAGCKRVIDIRLNNTSQLAGFAKRDDLAFFARQICGAEYIAVPALAPEAGPLQAYRSSSLGWDGYAAEYEVLLAARKVEETLLPSLFDGAVLLCSEDSPDRCHRRLAAEYLQRHWDGVSIRHL